EFAARPCPQDGWLRPRAVLHIAEGGARRVLSAIQVPHCEARRRRHANQATRLISFANLGKTTAIPLCASVLSLSPMLRQTLSAALRHNSAGDSLPLAIFDGNSGRD